MALVIIWSYMYAPGWGLLSIMFKAIGLVPPKSCLQDQSLVYFGVLQKFLGHSPQLDGECWHTLKDDGMCAFMHCENLHDFQLNNTFTHRLAFNFAQAYLVYRIDNPAWFKL